MAFVMALICAHPISAASVAAALLGVLVGAWVASADDADLAHDVELALRPLCKKEASAVIVGLSPQRFSRQLNCHEPLTFLARAMTRIEGFEREFLTIRAKRAQLLVVERGEIADAVTALRSFVMAKADMKVGA